MTGGVKTFNFISSVKLSSIQGHEIYSELNNTTAKAEIPAGRMVTLYTKIINGNKCFVVKTGDDYETFKNSKVFENFLTWGQLPFEKINDAGYDKPYMTIVSNDISKQIGIGWATHLLIHIPGLDSGGWSRQIVFLTGIGPIWASADGENKTKFNPQYTIAYRISIEKRWSKWFFHQMMNDGHTMVGIIDPNYMCKQRMSYYMPWAHPNNPNGCSDGILIPYTWHDGSYWQDDSAYPDMINNKCFLQVAHSWHQTAMYLRSYVHARGSDDSTRWSKWEQVLTDGRKTIIDRQPAHMDPTTISLAIGDTDTGFNWRQDGELEFVANGKRVFLFGTYGFRSLDNSIFSTTHIEGTGLNGNDGTLYLNWVCKKPVYFKMPDDTHHSLQELFQFASEGKSKLAAALAGKGIPATINDSWDNLMLKINCMDFFIFRVFRRTGSGYSYYEPSPIYLSNFTAWKDDSTQCMVYKFVIDLPYLFGRIDNSICDSCTLSIFFNKRHENNQKIFKLEYIAGNVEDPNIKTYGNNCYAAYTVLGHRLFDTYQIFQPAKSNNTSAIGGTKHSCVFMIHDKSSYHLNLFDLVGVINHMRTELYINRLELRFDKFIKTT